MLERTRIAKSNSDTSYFFDLIYLGETMEWGQRTSYVADQEER